MLKLTTVDLGYIPTRASGGTATEISAWLAKRAREQDALDDALATVLAAARDFVLEQAGTTVLTPEYLERVERAIDAVLDTVEPGVLARFDASAPTEDEATPPRPPVKPCAS